MIDDDVVRLLYKEEYVGHGLSLRKVAAKVSISGQALYERFKALGLQVRTLSLAPEEDVTVDELLAEPPADLEIAPDPPAMDPPSAPAEEGAL